MPKRKANDDIVSINPNIRKLSDLNTNAIVAAEKPAITIQNLNDNCLLDICAYLNAVDLIQLSRANERFRKVIVQDAVIGRVLFNFNAINKITETEEIFKEIGYSMKKLVLHERNIRRALSTPFNEFLRLVVKYCINGKLTQIELNFSTENVDLSLMQKAMPFFANVEYLRYYDQRCSTNRDVFLDEFLKNALKLQSLSCLNIRTTGNWLRYDHLQQLKHLHLKFNQFANIALDDFIAFVQRKPALKSVWCSWAPSVRQLREGVNFGKIVAKNVPDIEEFQLMEQVDYSSSNRMAIQRYNFLTDFNNLKKLSIWKDISFANFNELLKGLAAKNTITHLTINYKYMDKNENQPKEIANFEEPFNDFSSLKILSLYNIGYIPLFYIPLLGPFISALSNLTACHLVDDFEVVQELILIIVTSATKLQNLILNAPSKNFGKRFYEKLIKIKRKEQKREGDLNERKPLCIHLDNATGRKLVLANRYDEQIIILKQRKDFE